MCHHSPLCSSHCICLDREFGMLHAMFFCSRSCLHMLLVLRFSLAGLGTPVQYCNSVPLAGPTAVLPCASDECRTTWRGPCTARPLAEVSVGCDPPATHRLALVCGGGVDSSVPPRGREEKNLETKVAGPVRRRTRSMRRCPAPTCTLPQNQAITRVAKIWQDFPSARHGMMPSPIRYGREESKTVKFPSQRGKKSRGDAKCTCDLRN